MSATIGPVQESIPFYRDSRVLAVLAQVIFVIIIALSGWFLINNMLTGLRESNIPIGWEFLQQEAGFAIAEGARFDPSDTYLRAFIVGVGNTVRVAISGIALATILGLIAGIARLSNNYLVNKLASGYIELIRNTPLLVQLFFWYFAIILKLPDIGDSIQIPGLAFLSKRGIALTWPFITQSGGAWLLWLAGALVVAFVAGYLRRRNLDRRGRVGSVMPWAIPAFLVVAIVGYFATASAVSLPEEISFDLRRGDRGVLYVDTNGDGRYRVGDDQPMARVPITLFDADGRELGRALTGSEGEFRFLDLEAEGTEVRWEVPEPIAISRPAISGFNYAGGQMLSPEFAALLLGLVVYTAAFIAEIVRAGIQAVPNGQWEAARALGLGGGETLRMIVLPQALRVIIPPLTSQYLNLTKNSSLAIAVGYPDLFNVSRTIFNQSGAAIQMFVLIMGTYLSISLLTSAFMNWYNRRVALVER